MSLIGKKMGVRKWNPSYRASKRMLMIGLSPSKVVRRYFS
jgi:hypothetical protein